MNQREIQRLLKTNFAYSKILLLTHENKNMCKYARKLLRRVWLCYLDTKKLFPFSNGRKNHKHTVCYILSGHQQIKEGQMLTVSEFKKQFSQLWPVWPNVASFADCAHFGRMWPVWPIVPILAECGQFGRLWSVWRIMASLAECGQFGRIWPFWPNLANFAYCGHFGRLWPFWPIVASLADCGHFGLLWPFWRSIKNGVL